MKSQFDYTVEPKIKRINIEITQEDIDRAFRNNSHKCVVAQAIAQRIKGASNIRVDASTIRFTLNGQRLTWVTPYTVRDYVIDFDGGRTIVPFKFRVDNPMVMKQRILTDAGRERHRIKSRERRTARKAGTLPTQKAAPLLSSKAQARKATSKSRPKLTTEPKHWTRSPGNRSAIKLQFPPQGNRIFGAHRMRINQKYPDEVFVAARRMGWHNASELWEESERGRLEREERAKKRKAKRQPRARRKAA